MFLTEVRQRWTAERADSFVGTPWAPMGLFHLEQHTLFRHELQRSLVKVPSYFGHSVPRVGSERIKPPSDFPVQADWIDAACRSDLDPRIS